MRPFLAAILILPLTAASAPPAPALAPLAFEQMGPGPRDGLMTGLCRRTGWPVKWVRTSIEIAVLAIGWMLGGTVGVGTILYAATIGWIVHHALPFFRIAPAERPAQA